MTTKQAILRQIEKYASLLSDASATDRDIERADDELDAIAPHSFLADMLGWGERRRTNEEIAEEAELREALWHEGGEEAVLIHVRKQLTAAWEQPRNPMQEHCCSEMVSFIDGRLAALRGKTTH